MDPSHSKHQLPPGATSLGPRQIRLARITDGTPFVLETCIVDLDDAPEYNAVSYTCGTVMGPRPVSLDGVNVFLKVNLIHAILMVKGSCQREGRYLWADAICINQEDDQERSSQLLHMREIYERASKVVVSLGLASHTYEAQLAGSKMWKLHERVRELRHEDGRRFGLFEAIIKLLQEPEVLYDEVEGVKCYKAWQGIDACFRAPYWSRTWTVQESTIPDSEVEFTKVLFVIGYEAVPWNVIMFILCLLATMQTNGQLPFDGFVDISAPLSVMNYRNSRKQDSKQPLEHILGRFRLLQAFDPRDKVYVPFRLSNNVQSEQLDIDYQKSVCQVYWEVAMILIKNRENQLDFLGLVIRPDGVGDTTEALPSWIPDWSWGTTVRELPKLSTPPSTPSLLLECPSMIDSIQSHKRFYHADGGQSSSVYCHGYNLVVHGCFFDCIVDVTDVFITDIKSCLRTAFTWQSQKSSDEHNISCSRQSTYRTLSAGTGNDMQYDEENNPLYMKGEIPTWLDDDLDISEIVEHAYLDNLERFISHRRLAITASGRLGLVPAAARRHDKIAMLFGGQLLYILRPMESEGSSASDTCQTHSSELKRHEFVGECYIDGLMYGEVRQLYKVDPVCIELC